MEQELTPPPRQIYLLGAFRVYKGGILTPLSGEKSQALLAYLVLHPRLPHRREKLADMFFQDAALDRVRRNFSDILYRLQKTLGSDWLVIEGDTVALRMDQLLWVDVWEFEHFATSDQEADIHKAVDLYAGDLLPELYDDWLLAERELCRNQYLSTLENLAALQEKKGELRQALLTWRRLVSAEPLHEPAHQAYLRLLGRLQRFGEALAHYEYLRGLLHAELQSEPLAETRQIAESIARERSLAAEAAVEERTPFVGRKAERAVALSAVEAMLKGKGGVMAIEGEAGIGKSRLLREIAASVRWRGATLLQGVASETPSASPLSPLVDALTPVFNGPRSKQLETLLTDDTLAILAPLNPAWGEKATLSEATPELTARRFYNALRPFGENLARLTPLVLAVDDLQWADTVLWKSLDVLAQSLARSGGLLIVIYRRPEIEHTPGWDVIQAWDRVGLVNTISLQPLNVEDVAQLIGDTQTFNPAEVHAWAGGNPFYIHEWLAAPGSDSVPLHNAISRRLQKLSPASRFAVDSASIIGENIPYRLWTEISELSPLILAGSCDELMAQRWLQPTSSGYAFTHDLIRSAVYAEVDPARRRALHEKAALIYPTIEPDNLRARAFHCDQAGLQREAIAAYRQAGEQALAQFSFPEAQKAFDRALALLPSTPSQERVEISIALGNVVGLTGDRSRYPDLFQTAVAEAKLLENEPLLIRALLDHGLTEYSVGHTENSKIVLLEALALAEKEQNDERKTEAFWRLSRQADFAGDVKEALQWSHQALKLARATGNRIYEARIMRSLGVETYHIGDPDGSIQWLEQARELQRSIGDRLGVSLTEVSLLVAYYEKGAWDKLIDTAKESIPIMDATGNIVNAAIARHNHALGLYALGKREMARRILERVLTDVLDYKANQQIGLTRNVLGLVEEDDGNLEEALELYQNAVRDAEQIQAEDNKAYAQHDLGAMLTRLNRLEEAIPLLKSAHSYFEGQDNVLLSAKSETYEGLAWLAQGDRDKAEELALKGISIFKNQVLQGEQLQGWLWALYRLLAALDHTSDSIEVLTAAYLELQRQSRNISDGDLRHSFFENVPLNRSIVEAYDRHNRTARVIAVSLARSGAPLGRPLREDEYVPVQWTVSAPEDEAIADKTARRQYRLKRLLRQAASQNAAPTDEDLAGALGVSRRTILRDMQDMAHDFPSAPTRKRKT